MSIFAQVPKAEPIEIFSVNQAFLEDTFENKVDLAIGAVRNEKGELWVLPVVRQAEKSIASDENLNKEYLSILGMDSFLTQQLNSYWATTHHHYFKVEYLVFKYYPEQVDYVWPLNFYRSN